MGRWPRVMEGFLSDRKNPGEFWTGYRVTTHPTRIVSENRAVYRGWDRRSRSVHSLPGMDLVSYEESHVQKTGVKGALRFRLEKGVARIARLKNDDSWGEVVKFGPGRKVLPFTAFCYAELVLAMRMLDWASDEQQVFPMLHASCGSDFFFRDFYYFFRVTERSGDLGRVHCANVSDGFLGAQFEPYDLVVDRRDLSIQAVQPALRPMEFVAVGPGTSERILGLPDEERMKVRVPRRLVTKTIASNREPFELRLQETPSTSEPRLWLFDLVRTNRHLEGSWVLRRSISETLGPDLACASFDRLIGHTHVGVIKATSNPAARSFTELKAMILGMWRQLSGRRRRRTAILALEENAHLVPEIFAEEADRPPLVLVRPHWGTFRDWVRSLTGMEPKPEDEALAHLFPDQTLRAALERYDRPTLVIGELGGTGQVPEPLRRTVTLWDYALPPTSDRFSFPLRDDDRKTLARIREWVDSILR